MSEQKTPTELGTRPVGKLLLEYALPAIIAMTASSLYNLVDSIFIGQGVGAMAISGLAVTHPIMNVSAAFGAMVGVGGSAMISLKLGQRDNKTAQLILGNIVVLNTILGLILGILCLTFMKEVLTFFGATPGLMPYAYDYMSVIMWGNVFTHLYMGLNSVLRSAGHPRKAMGATMFTVIINCILDPIFIWPLGMGIKGAALATVISQALALVYQLKMLSNRDELLHLHRGIYRIRTHIVKGILSIGMSPFLMNLAACMVSTLVNQALIHHGGDMAIGAYGIINRVVFIFIMFIIGLNQGMQPIVGYNYGACQYHRVMQTLKYTIIWATCFSTLSFIVGTLLPEQCARMFTDDAELIGLIVEGMPIICICHVLIGFQIATTNFFQSIGMASKAVFLSLSRQLTFLLPLIIILPRFFGTMGVWWSMACSDLLSTLTTAVMLGMQMKKFKKLLAQEQTAQVEPVAQCPTNE